MKTVRLLIFGGGHDQLSMIMLSKKRGYVTVVIDPDPNAEGKSLTDHFECVPAQDFQGTCDVIEKYNITHIITVATDKPLVMMAKVAAKYNLEFISEEAARNCTDKQRMKEVLVAHNLPCARYREITDVTDDFTYPCVLKPKDNSGSRGVTICYNRHDAEKAIIDAKKHSKTNKVLWEEFLPGKEYSLESLHFNGKTKLLQITDKKMTELPYRCEMELTHPAPLSDKQFAGIEALVHDISLAFGFKNCASHCEILVNGDDIHILEASGRMAGDYICSHLVPLSTGIDMQAAALDIVIGETPDLSNEENKASGIYYFEFPEGQVKSIPDYSHIKELPGVIEFVFKLKAGDYVSKIKFGPDRYGYVILQADNREDIFQLKNYIFDSMKPEIN